MRRRRNGRGKPEWRGRFTETVRMLNSPESLKAHRGYGQHPKEKTKEK